MNYETDAVVAGHVCLDITPAFAPFQAQSMSDIFIPGRLINMNEIHFSMGGPVPNTGIALHILGAKVKLMGKLGNDFLGDAARRNLSEIDAADTMKTVDGEQTSYTVVIVPPGFDRIFLHNPGANNTFDSADIDYEAVARAKLFHLGYPPLMRRMYENCGKELAMIFRKAKETGVTTSLDMSLPDATSDSGKADWEEILKQVLPWVDIFIPSVEEMMFMLDKSALKRLTESAAEGRDVLEALDMNELRELGEKMLEFGAKIAVIKCGVKGYYIVTAGKARLADIGRAKPGSVENWADRELIEESFHVENVVSATGSGDSSIAGFLASYLKGLSIEACVRIACCVGAQNVQAVDATSGIHSWQETVAMMDGWKKNRQQIEGGYFRYIEGVGLWAGKRDRLYG